MREYDPRIDTNWSLLAYADSSCIKFHTQSKTIHDATLSRGNQSRDSAKNTKRCWLSGPLGMRLQFLQNLSKSLQYLLIRIPIPALMRFEEAPCQRMRRVGIQFPQPIQHNRIEQKGLRDLGVYPWVDRVGRCTPAKRVRDMVFYFRNTAK